MSTAKEIVIIIVVGLIMLLVISTVEKHGPQDGSVCVCEKATKE